MNNLILIYHIVLTVVLTIGLTGFYVIYMKNKQSKFLLLSMLFLIFILDNSTIFLSEFSENFYLLYENSTLLFVFLDFTYLGIVLLLRFILAEQFNDNFTQLEIGFSVFIPVSLGILSFFGPSHVAETAIYFCFFSALIYLSVRTYRHIKVRIIEDKTTSRIQALYIISIILLCILGIVESNFYYFVSESNVLLSIDALEYRFLSFDIIKLLVSIVGIRYLFNSFETLFNQKSAPEKIDTFCHEHGLTARQKDIIELVIAGCSNKEIGEQLHITEGTVKTHIYNIFKKVDVSNRNQIISKIMHQ